MPFFISFCSNWSMIYYVFITSRPVPVSKLTQRSLMLILSFSCGSWGSESGPQTSEASSLPTKPSHSPQVVLTCSIVLYTMLFFNALKTISTFFFCLKKWGGCGQGRHWASSSDLHVPACSVSHTTASAALEQTAVFLPSPGLGQEPPLPATLYCQGSGE